MTAEGNIPAETPKEAPQPALKRRRVRKGTQSCWECKRRKIRCTFANPAESVCDGCRSRGVKCVGQEFHYDQVEVASVNTSVLDGQDLVQVSSNHPMQACDSDRLVNDGEIMTTRTRPKTSSTNQSSVCPSGPQRVSYRDASASGSQVTSNPIGPTTNNKHDERCNALRAAWPNQRDIDAVTSIPVGTWVLFHGTVCISYSRLLSKELPLPQETLQLPPPGSHPVLIARQLLLLGSFIQGVPTGAVAHWGSLAESYRRMKLHVVETANRLVTCDDSLIESLEGVECIMIESMYHNNAGNLRRAWLTNRRAMLVAQMIGVDRGSSSLPNVLDVKSRERIDPAYMWFRLVTSDRYLSLMLGLPHCMAESPLASIQASGECLGLERMERLEALVGGLLLQRKSKDVQDLEATNKIDGLLLDAAASMPPHWWLTPDTDAIAGRDTNAFSETIRIMHQFVHYHLLARLHLPYMLRSSADSSLDMVAAYCRGVDFLAFIASTTLCLAHIDSRRQHVQRIGERNTCVFRTLAHQRLVDRGLMERTLQIMEQMVQSEPSDAIAREVAHGLHRLLVVEAAAAKDNRYTYSASLLSTDTERQYYSGSGIDVGSDVCRQQTSTETLRVQIPHFGTIKIERGGAVQYHVDKAQHHHDGNRVVGGQNAWPVHLASKGVSLKSTLPRVDADNSGHEQEDVIDWQNTAQPLTSLVSHASVGDATTNAACLATHPLQSTAVAVDEAEADEEAEADAEAEEAGFGSRVTGPAAEPRPQQRSFSCVSPHARSDVDHFGLPQAATTTSSGGPPFLSDEFWSCFGTGDEWTGSQLQGVDAALFESLLFFAEDDDHDNNTTVTLTE